MAAEGIRYVAIDGPLFNAVLKTGDLLFELQERQPTVQTTPLVKGVIKSLFKQDFGATAATLFEDSAGKFEVGQKKVSILEFITKWNKHNKEYLKHLKNNNLVGIPNIVKFLDAIIAKGDEPWLYAQLLPLGELLNMLDFHGLVYSVDNVRTGQQALQLRGPKPLCNVFELDLGHWTLPRVDATGKALYLLCIENLGDQPAGMRFEIVLTDNIRKAALEAVDKDRINADLTLDARVGFMRLGSVLGGNMFSPNIASRWEFLNMGQLVRYPDVHQPTSAPTRKRLLSLVDIQYGSGGTKTTIKYQKIS